MRLGLLKNEHLILEMQYDSHEIVTIAVDVHILFDLVFEAI